MFRRLVTVTFSSLLCLCLTVGTAAAHAVVYPKTMTADSFEKFVLRVPTEKESATVQVRVEIPDGFAVSRVKPLPGWAYKMDKSADGAKVSAITWSGGKIEPGEFQEFEFSGKTAAQPGKYAFRAFQTYADGETVEWTGPSDAKTPASFVELKAAATATDAHGQEKASAAQPAAGQAPKDQQPVPAASPFTTAAAYGGLALGAAALLISLRRRA